MNNNSEQATIRFNVKDKSALIFFREHGVDKEHPRGMIGSDEMSAYYFMKDEIYLKKAAWIEVGTTVVFDLTDMSLGSRRELTNVYTYKVEAYDDVCVKLVLENFDVKAKS
jgi:hypothetical protein